MKLGLAMIVKGVDTEAKYLKRCLANVSVGVDGIFITITHEKGVQPSKEVEKVCKEFKANISYYEWDKDFAKARNYNFDRVPKEFTHILWCDADDNIRGIEKLKPTIEENPQVDVFVMTYLYAFDEYKNATVVHLKTQVVKNDGCVKWEAKLLHEDFTETRVLSSYKIEGIDRIHLSDDERFEEAKIRNYEISQEAIKRFPDDPRVYCNFGNSAKAIGKNQEALEIFEKFMETSESEEEKYIVTLRIAESLWQLGRKSEAIDHCNYAIGLRTEYPDAYNLKGSLLLESGKFELAAESILKGIVKKPPYNSIIVYNPRDYDYVPMMNLAKAYHNLSRPDLALVMLKGCEKIVPSKEVIDLIKIMTIENGKFQKVIKIVKKLEGITDKKKLKTELDKLPPEIRQHPSICIIRNRMFIKEKSSGKDIVFYCGYTAEEWTPETARVSGIGGSEEAVINLSAILNTRGYNVTIYNNCGHTEQVFDGVTYKPFWTFNVRDKQDAVVLWRTPIIAKHEINSDKIFIDLHDVISDGEFTKERLDNISKVFVKSEFHKSLFTNIPEDKFVVVPNGIYTDLFKKETKRDHLIINTSSPDRSLSAFCEIVKEVKKKDPNVKAQWAYGWGVYDAVYKNDTKMMEWKEMMKKKMVDSGVEELGRLSHSEIAKLYNKAKVFLYPSEFAEIDNISLTKAMASGCVPITSDFAAMGDKVHKDGYFFKSDKTKDNWATGNDYSFKGDLKQFVKATLKVLKQMPDTKAMRSWTDKFDWEKVADVWEKEIIRSNKK